MKRSLVVALITVASVSAQQPKNVKILTGMSRPEVQRVMNEMRAGLGVHCHYCHVGQDPAVDGTPQKERARDMMRMVIDLNQKYFGGKEVVTCFTCHNGSPHPKVVPPLPQPLPLDLPANPPVVETKKVPAPAEVLEKYVKAVGRILPAGEPRSATVVSASPLGGPIAMKIQESGDRTRVDVTFANGEAATQVLTAAGGWVRDKSGVRDLGSEQLVSARMSRRPYTPFTETSFPADAKVTADKIGDQEMWVVTTAGAQYWFHAESGLLIRRILYYPSPLGRIPEQTEFDHYREVSGVKIPFTTRVALVDPWLGGTRQATAIVIGKPIAETEFEKP